MQSKNEDIFARLDLMQNYLHLTPTHNNKFIIVEDFKYKDVVVPQGYKTNGANIPRALWCIVPPFKPKYLKAVVLHDYLCDKEEYKKADEVFEEVLFSIEKSLKTKMMIKAVKLYHKFKYKI